MASNEERNSKIFESSDRVRTYGSDDGLTPAEEYLFEKYIRPGERILDLGVGTGRTYPALAARSSSYVGIDYSRAMITAAQANHPDGNFMLGDASDLSQFADESFDAVVFSYNGLDYMMPVERRRRTLSEVRRVLRPGGVFIYSSHNPRAIIRRRGPGTAVKSWLVSAVGTARAWVWMLPRKPFWRGSGYGTDHVNGLTTYFGTPDRLCEELSAASFTPIDMVGGYFPSQYRSFVTPWTYMVATRGADPRATTEVIRGELPEEAESAWDRLFVEREYSPFVSREWVDVWYDVLAPDAERLTVIARDSSREIIGVLPLALTSRHLHSHFPISLRYLALAGAGVGAGDHMGPVCADPETAESLFRAAGRLAGRYSLLLENLDEEWVGVASLATQARIVRHTECMVATRRTEGTFADRWTKKARKNIRRHQRQIDAAGIQKRWVDAADDFKSALESLSELHRMRWQSKGQAGLFDDVRFRFILRLASLANKSLESRILVLEKGGRPLAAMLVFITPNRLSIYKTGWDPSHGNLSLGVAMGVEAMEYAEACGLHVVDYLRGSRGHKLELGCQPVPDTTLIRSRGLSGWLLFAREYWSAERDSSRLFNAKRNSSVVSRPWQRASRQHSESVR